MSNSNTYSDKAVQKETAKIIALVSNIKKVVDSTVNGSALLLLTALVFVTSLQVFSRYVLNRPIVWSEELARYIFIWIVFLATSIAFRINKHLSVDFVVTIFPSKVQKLISILGNIIIAIFLITVICISPKIVTITFMQTSATLSLPLGYIYLAFPVSAALMFLELVFRFILAFDSGKK